jgi:protein phosphatase
MVDFAGETHVGTKLDHNEDAIGWLIPFRLWLVADGMGGQASGEIASRVVKESVLKRIRSGEDDIVAVILQAHAAVLEAAAVDPRLQGMGSTLVVARLLDGICQVAWCGDSRAYLWREGRLQRMTRDHSYLEELIESGELEPENARYDPRQRVLRQAMGAADTPVPEVKVFPVQTGDLIILCSDGLHDTLSDTEIAAVLNASAAPNDASRSLVRAALDHQAEDNVSVVAIRCP